MNEFKYSRIWITCVIVVWLKGAFDLLLNYECDSGIANFYWSCMNGERFGMRSIQVPVYTGEQCKTWWAQPPVCIEALVFNIFKT